MVIQVYAQTSNTEEAEVEQFYGDLQDLLELTPKIDVLFTIGDWNAKVGSQEIPGLTSVWPWSTKWSKAKDNRVLSKEHAGHNKNPPRDNSTHGHNQMVNTEIKLIVFFVAKEGEALYSQQKRDLELTVAQVISFLLQNSGLNWKKRKLLDYSAMT